MLLLLSNQSGIAGSRVDCENAERSVSLVSLHFGIVHVVSGGIYLSGCGVVSYVGINDIACEVKFPVVSLHFLYRHGVHVEGEELRSQNAVVGMYDVIHIVVASGRSDVVVRQIEQFFFFRRIVDRK